jgi:Ca-activated chloride channel family protein
MRRTINVRPVVFIILAALGLLAAACSPSAEKLNAEGNDRFTKEAYLEALAAYQSAQIESPELAEPYYNAANALYRQGAYPEALEQMEEALRYAADQTIAENGFFNRGNASFSLQSWEEAIQAYTEALLLNPDDQDAKYNLELALQQMQQQEQQQQDQEQQEQSEEQQDQESDQQQDQSQSGEDQQEQNQEQGEEGSEEGQNENQEQEQEGQNQDGQEQQEQGQNQGNGQGGQPDENESQEQPSQMPPPGQRMTAEQAKQLLAAIAQDSDTLQERLGQIFVVPPVPPVQDW